MALTLNGIAQGYVTDRIAALLAAEGLGDLLVHMGETRAAGTRPDGEAWRAAIVGPGTGLLREVTLAGRALATSAPDGTLIDRRRGIGHIFDPATGMTAAAWDVVSVSAPRAAVADGLSTAFCLMTRAQIDRAMAGFADARIEALA
jgi:thiamine biosynthesis lipoprotein